MCDEITLISGLHATRALFTFVHQRLALRGSAVPGTVAPGTVAPGTEATLTRREASETGT